MIYTSIITQKGQILIPKKLRDAMNISPNRRVRVSQRVEGGKVVVIVESAPDIMQLAGAFKPKRKTINPVKIREYMETHYERA